MTLPPSPRAAGAGSLFLVGGAEQRDGDMPVLARLVALAGVARTRDQLVVLSAASSRQGEVQRAYAAAFAALGVPGCHPLVVEERAQAEGEAAVRALRAARLVFITGGDQRRLLARTGGTRLAAALREALRAQGACIAGTSAGAAALSACMLASPGPDDHARASGGSAPGGEPEAALSPGLGLVPGLVIDQHFSQRQRLRRLLLAVAAHPRLLGVGIDEDTALHLVPGRALEVVGQGAVTLVDGTGVPPGAAVDALHLHRLPAGTRFEAAPGGPAGPGSVLQRLLDAAVA